MKDPEIEVLFPICKEDDKVVVLVRIMEPQI